MQLSKRLQRVIAQVEHGDVVADIGCDHGFTSIALIEENRADHVIAMDINKGPLLRASEHIAEAGLTELIETRLSDGVAEMEPGEADTLLISGMGGALICKILQDHPQVVQRARELVLSPQSEIYLVRHMIHDLGYAIDREEMLLDQGKYYVVIHAVRGTQQYERAEEYIYGKALIEQKSPVLQRFLIKEKNRVESILQAMQEKQLTETSVKKVSELNQQKEQMEWTLHQIQ